MEELAKQGAITLEERDLSNISPKDREWDENLANFVRNRYEIIKGLSQVL